MNDDEPICPPMPPTLALYLRRLAALGLLIAHPSPYFPRGALLVVLMRNYQRYARQAELWIRYADLLRRIEIRRIETQANPVIIVRHP